MQLLNLDLSVFNAVTLGDATMMTDDTLLSQIFIIFIAISSFYLRDLQLYIFYFYDSIHLYSPNNLFVFEFYSL